jgi:hypothetical protein
MPEDYLICRKPAGQHVCAKGRSHELAKWLVAILEDPRNFEPEICTIEQWLVEHLGDINLLERASCQSQR